MLTCSLFITYHRFVTVIDTVLIVIHCCLLSIIGLIMWSWFTPLCLYMLGMLHKMGVIIPWGLDKSLRFSSVIHLLWEHFSETDDDDDDDDDVDAVVAQLIRGPRGMPGPRGLPGPRGDIGEPGGKYI